MSRSSRYSSLTDRQTNCILRGHLRACTPLLSAGVLLARALRSDATGLLAERVIFARALCCAPLGSPSRVRSAGMQPVFWQIARRLRRLPFPTLVTAPSCAQLCGRLLARRKGIDVCSGTPASRFSNDCGWLWNQQTPARSPPEPSVELLTSKQRDLPSMSADALAP